MSHPNTDRDERVRQIRERQRTRPVEAVEDIEFLLSLLNSQVVDYTRPIGWISCGLRQGRDNRIVDIVFENADCAKAFIDGVEPIVGPVVAATAMRDRCVAKVRERAAKRLREAAEVEEDDYQYSRALGCAGDQLEEVANELQSLTLDQVEQEKQK